ncbi:MAG: hypothetical protein A2176_06975 [Spirochaetes bacterium RBG_13_51_14]|nr:MAG: hypothetical protein A2176_06975 [Spirochaetes bacterium RBG_13_51_14]
MNTKRNYMVAIITAVITIITFSSCSNSGGNQSLPLLVAGLNAQKSTGPALSSDTTIATTIGDVQGTALVNIPFGTTVENLKAAVTAAQGAVFDIFEADGMTPAVELNAECALIVSAEDGTQASYTINILPDPAILVEWIGFDPESPDYTIVNAQTVEGYNGNPEALYFDGDPATLDYVTRPDSESMTLRNSGTIEVLVKADAIFPFAGIVHKGEKRDFSDESWGIQLYYHENSHARLLFMVTGDDGNWIGVHGTFDLQPGQWYHIIGTWDETSLRLYVNGVRDGEIANTTGGVRDTDGAVIIGAQLSEMYDSGYGNIGWDGIIDRVIIRSDTMSDEQALEHYNSL